MKLTSITSLLVGMLLSMSVIAHHSPVTLYLVNQRITVEGTVTEFRLGNPHTRIYLTVTNEDGEEEKWLAEGGTRSVMLRRGWEKDTIKVGEYVKIIGNPARDGSNLVHALDIFMPDGRRLVAEDVDFDDIDERFRKRIQKKQAESSTR